MCKTYYIITLDSYSSLPIDLSYFFTTGLVDFSFSYI